ncbi:MAG TPA: hypothetical protein VN476_09595 [Pyrinomonadaceae bacterium]|nr:hypothetical protein [Pyrinomonadaceae bacterium]
MLERLFAFIEEYQLRVREAASLFHTHRNVDNPMYWRHAGLQQTGFIDSAGTIEYAFHGIGCRVGLPSGEVDWDFGHDGRLDGLNPWFLWQFAQYGTDRFLNSKTRSISTELLMRQSPTA